MTRHKYFCECCEKDRLITNVQFCASHVKLYGMRDINVVCPLCDKRLKHAIHAARKQGRQDTKRTK